MVYTPVAESNIGFDPENKFKMLRKKNLVEEEKNNI